MNMACPHCGRRDCRDCDEIDGDGLARLAAYTIRVAAFSADVDRLHKRAMA